MMIRARDEGRLLWRDDLRWAFEALYNMPSGFLVAGRYSFRGSKSIMNCDVLQRPHRRTTDTADHWGMAFLIPAVGGAFSPEVTIDRDLSDIAKFYLDRLNPY
jgi:hypothetical protein